MNCVVNITSGAFTAKNTTFQGATTITKTGATNDASAGGNIVQRHAECYQCRFRLSAVREWQCGDQFNAASTFINSGSANNLYVANSGTLQQCIQRRHHASPIRRPPITRYTSARIRRERSLTAISLVNFYQLVPAYSFAAATAPQRLRWHRVIRLPPAQPGFRRARCCCVSSRKPERRPKNLSLTGTGQPCKSEPSSTLQRELLRLSNSVASC